MTKIDIVSGFLGAGKTTLIKKLIQESLKEEKIVLIENEFGEIGIDGGFLKDAGVQITEMNSGCICCTLVGDFGTALKDVLTQFNPTRVIIEPSGVGKLSDVAKAVEDVKKKVDIELNSMVTIVDGTKVKMYMKNFGEFFNNQIENATSIIMSRTQKMKEERLEESVKLLKEHNKNAVIITTPWEELSGNKILEAIENIHTFEAELMEETKSGHTCSGHHHEDNHEEHAHRSHECCGHDHGEHHHEDKHHNHECSCSHGHEEHEHHHHECCCGHDNHEHHHADEVFTSWGKETPHKYKENEIKSILETLSTSEELGMVLRAKGIVPGETNQWIYFDMVPGEYEVRQGEADYTGRICVIGSDLKEEKLEELFQLI